MRHDSRHLLSRNDEEQLAAPQSGLHKHSSAVSPTEESALNMLRISELAEQCLREINAYRREDAPADDYSVELLRRATMHNNQEAQVCLQLCLNEIVCSWLRRHPRWYVALDDRDQRSHEPADHCCSCPDDHAAGEKCT